MGKLFGTDGVRGVANEELTCELAFKIGRCAAFVLTGEIKRKPEFEAKMRFHAFDDLRLNKRVSFLSYDAFVKQYEMEQEKQSFEFIL